MYTIPWRLLSTGFTLSASIAASACATLAGAPAGAPPSITGEWRQDAAASDDFARKLAPLLATERQRALPRRRLTGAAGDGGTNGIDPLILPPEDPEKVRARLTDELHPPAALRIALDGDVVEIASDAEPVRRFQPGQSVSRIDSSGAANLSSGWDQSAFVVRARYTNHGSRSWRYELEPASGILRVTFEANDPEFGRFTLQTRYRRAS